MFKHIDEPLLCFFVERWHPETNTFLMPFGEMSVTFYDTAFILGVPVAGDAVTPPCDGSIPKVLRVSTVSLGHTGTVEELKTITGWNACSVKHTNMRDLVDWAGCRASRKARVYLWWVLTNTLFGDRSKTHGVASFIELLRAPTEASRYAWGATALAHLYRDLGMTSRCDCRQLGVRWTGAHLYMILLVMYLSPLSRALSTVVLLLRLTCPIVLLVSSVMYKVFPTHHWRHERHVGPNIIPKSTKWSMTQLLGSLREDCRTTCSIISRLPLLLQILGQTTWAGIPLGHTLGWSMARRLSCLILMEWIHISRCS